MTTSGDRSSGLGGGTKLAVYGLVLAAMLGGGAVVGAAIGPEPSDTSGDEHADDDHAATADETAGGDAASDAPAVPGLAMTQDGYTFDLRTRAVPAGTGGTLDFVIERSDGQPLRDYEIEHDKELHLVVVSRDLASYAHVHPERDDAGTWSVALPPLAAGSYRVYADFVPAGRDDGLTLARDIVVTGTVGAPATPQPSRSASVDGYDVELAGELVAGTESELTVTVSRDGAPVDDLQPYLGALGHLVAIRDGDLAYLHVHPLDETDGPGGPAVRFAVEVPNEGTYGLYFDFSHGGDVRTASVITPASGDVEDSDHADDGGDADDEHDAHGG